jgi:hypothetical protein
MYGMPAHHAKLQDGKKAVFFRYWPNRGEESHDRALRKPIFQAFSGLTQAASLRRPVQRLWTGDASRLYYRASSPR